MDLHPRDLGTERYLAIVRRRLTPTMPQGSPVPPLDETPARVPRSRRLRRQREKIRRYWVRDLKVDEATGEKVANMLYKGTPGVGARVGAVIVSIYLLLPMLICLLAGAPPPFPIFLALTWALVMAAIIQSPRRTIRQLDEKVLTGQEVEAMLPIARGRLERSYLQLVLEAMRQDIPSATAQNDIRAALRDLGDTVSRLPADAVPVPNSAALRDEARLLRNQAALENDSLVRTSQLRQAETLERRAALADQNGVALRRLATLRREARTQMDALRAVLAGFQNTNHWDHAQAAHLTESLSRAASEAQSVAIARRELEDEEIAALFGAPLPPVQQPVQAPPQVATQPVVAPPLVQQQVGQATPVPAPQPVQPRQWWRNGGG